MMAPSDIKFTDLKVDGKKAVLTATGKQDKDDHVRIHRPRGREGRVEGRQAELDQHEAVTLALADRLPPDRRGLLRRASRTSPLLRRETIRDASLRDVLSRREVSSATAGVRCDRGRPRSIRDAKGCFGCLLPTDIDVLYNLAMSSPARRTELLKGTLDLLILRTLALEPRHGLAIAERIEQITRGTFVVKPGSLFPALHRLEQEGSIAGAWGESAERLPREDVPARGRRAPAARAGEASSGSGSCSRWARSSTPWAGLPPPARREAPLRGTNGCRGSSRLASLGRTLFRRRRLEKPISTTSCAATSRS